MRADQGRQILGHGAGFHGLHANLLQSLGKLGDVRGIIHAAAMLQATGPGKDRGDRISRRLIAFLMLPVMAGDGTMGRFGLNRLAVWGHQDRGHQA